MTNLLLERCLLACRLLMLLAFVLVLSACGPGSGGTGTGPTLSFTAVSSNPAQVPGGSVGVGCGRLDLQLQDGRVELVADCGSFAFDGAWAADSSGLVVLEGALQNSTAGSSVNVTLQLQFNGAPETSPTVTLTILDAGGRVVIAPTVLSRVDILPP